MVTDEDKKMVEEFLSACHQNEHRLYDREYEFFQDIEQRWRDTNYGEKKDTSFFLTPKQWEWMGKITGKLS